MERAMDTLYVWLALFLLVNIVVGFIRVLRGPTAADRMLAAELFGTAAVAVMLLLAGASGEQALVDVALVFALLSALAVVTFVSRAWTAIPTRDADKAVDAGKPGARERRDDGGRPVQ